MVQVVAAVQGLFPLVDPLNPAVGPLTHPCNTIRIHRIWACSLLHSGESQFANTAKTASHKNVNKSVRRSCQTGTCHRISQSCRNTVPKPFSRNRVEQHESISHSNPQRRGNLCLCVLPDLLGSLLSIFLVVDPVCHYRRTGRNLRFDRHAVQKS